MNTVIREEMTEKNWNIYELLNKYSALEDLKVILDVCIEQERYDCVKDILLAFPRSTEYDDLKVDTIKKCYKYIGALDLVVILMYIIDDEIKLKLFNTFFDIINDDVEMRDFNIVRIINSYQNDQVKMEQYRKYQSCYNGHFFSLYVASLKDKDIRKTEFAKFKNNYEDISISIIAISFSNDEEKMQFYEDNFELADEEELSYFIYNLETDKARLDFFNKHVHDPNALTYMAGIIKSFQDSEIKADFIGKYGYMLSSSDLCVVLEEINDKSDRIRCLEKVADQLDSFDLSHLMGDLYGEQDFMRLLSKYRDKIKLNMVCKHLSEEDFQDFLDNNISIFEGSELASSLIIYLDLENTLDRFNKYSEYFSCEDIFFALYYLYNHCNISISECDVLLNRAKEKLNSKEDRRFLYNVIAKIDDTYFREYLLEDGDDLFSLEEKKLFDRLYERNNFVFNTLNFKLLEIPELRKNFAYLEKFSKYDDIANEICNFYSGDDKKTHILFLILDMIDSSYASLSKLIIKWFSSNRNAQLVSDLDFNTLDKEMLVNLMFKILRQSDLYNDNIILRQSDLHNGNIILWQSDLYNGNIDVKVENVNDLKNYRIRFNERIDLLFNEASEVEKVKDCIFNKHFGISLHVAKERLRLYGYSIEKFNNSLEFDYLRKLKYILELDNYDQLRDYYLHTQPMKTEDIVFIEQNINKKFNQSIKGSLLDIHDCLPLKDNSSGVDIYVPKGDFKLLINSLCAFRGVGQIDDYNKFWNKNNSLSTKNNHGICCSLISNQNITQTAPINDVVVGFNDFSDDAIQLMNAYDIGSKNDDYELSSYASQRFMFSQDLIDNTRHDHNELVLERVDTRNSNCCNLQPNYVVVYEDMNYDIFKRSLKAARELNVPIIYLETEKIVKNESTYIDSLGEQLMHEISIEKFREMIVRRENNVHSFIKRCGDFVQEYFSAAKIDCYIDGFYKNIVNQTEMEIITPEAADDLFRNIINILEEEKEKRLYLVTGELDIENSIEKAQTCRNSLYQKGNINVVETCGVKHSLY